MSALPPDDDRTRMPPPGRTGSVIRAAMPAAVSDPAPDDGNALPTGTRLGEFELLGVIGIGGFGIVYLAYDDSLQRRVALKEYMPSSLAARSSQAHVTVKSQRHADTFKAGMRSFINEARLLAQFDHPALLKVYRFWEGNGTAYMVMPYYQGPTLTQALRARAAPPDEAWLRALLAPLLDALEAIHAEKCFHRDIAPDNILMLADDRPLLLDFGAARRAIAGMAQSFTVILKPGYAPIEQYADITAMEQGAWTDIYALASVVHFAITGRPPAPAVARMVADPQVPLARSAAGRYSDAFLTVIDQALSVRPEQRPQSVAELRTKLGLPSARRDAAASAAPPQPPLVAADRAPLPPPPNPMLRKLLAGGAVVVAIVAGGIYYVTRQPAPPRSVPQASVPPAPAPAPAVPPSAPDPVEVLNQVAAAGNREHVVTVSVKDPVVRIGKDRLRFSVRSSRPGYLYVLMVGTDQSQFWLLFPNELDRENRIGAGRTLELPRRSWWLDAAGPAGTDQLVAIVSEAPRDFSAAGLQPSSPFAEFPKAALARAGSGGAVPLFAGQAKCADPGGACPQSYGAALFSIQESAAP